MKNKLTAAVIGAGTLGLVTAYYLAQNGYEVTVFEKNDKIGGMAEGYTLSNGQWIDKFYHYFCMGDKEVFALIKQLGIENKLHFEKVKTSLTYRRDNKEIVRVHLDDFIDLLALKDISATAKLRFLAHMAYLKIFNPLHHDKIGVTENYRAIEGDEAFSFFWKYHLTKKFHQYTSHISALFLDYRIKRVLDSKSLFGGTKYGFYEGGANQLLSELRKTLLNMGVTFRLNTEVTKISCEKYKNHRVRVTYNDPQAKTSKEKFYDDCAVTVPTPYLASILDGLNEREKTFYKTIHNCSCICVVYELEKPFSDSFWNNYKGTKGTYISGIIDYSPIKSLKRNLIYVPQYLAQNNDILKYSDEEIIEYVTKKLSRQIEDNKILSAHCFRYKYAQPVFECKFFRKIRGMNTSMRGVYRADTTFAYPNDRCMNECIKTAKNLASTIISNHKS